MIGLDTNVLARYYVAEADAHGADPAAESQRAAARALIESARPLFLPKTVSLELEWVLRGYYRFPVADVLRVFEHLLSLESLTLKIAPARSRPRQACALASISPTPCTTPVAVPVS